MEAPERGGRITPLPPHFDDAPQPTAGPRRPWAPVLVALGGVSAFALWLGASTPNPLPPEPGTGSGQTPAALSAPEPLAGEEAAATSTLTPAASLGEQLPWLDGSLMLFGRDGGSGALTVWRRSEAGSAAFKYSGSNVRQVEPEPRALDLIAYETDAPTASLYLGSWQRQDPIYVGSRGFGWDPRGSGTLAWVGTDQVTAETALYNWDREVGIRLVAPLPAGSRLLAWTEKGLVLSQELAAAVAVVDEVSGEMALRDVALTVLISPAGDEIAKAVAQPMRVSRNGTIVAIGTGDALDKAEQIPPAAAARPANRIVLLDSPGSGEQGFGIRPLPDHDLLPNGSPLLTADGRWSLTDDGNWIGRVANIDGTATLTVLGLRTGYVQTVAIRGPEPATGVGFLDGGAHYLVWRPTTKELISIAWLNGQQTVVPFIGDVRFGGAYVRP